MPQELHVIQCYSCHMYQVDIVKKAQTWTCKICQEKQSLKRVFFKGTGKDCRLHVQELNALKGINDHNYQSDGDGHQQIEIVDTPMEPIRNKWSKFIESSEQNESSYSEGVNEPAFVHNAFQRESSKETTQTNHSIQKSKKTDHSMPMWNDFVDNKDNDLSHQSKEYDDTVNKKRKVDNDMSKESKWSKYLPDISDESN